VDAGAELDSSVEVGPYAIIGPHVRIGPGTVVGPHAVIEGRTEMGRDNHIFAGAQIGKLSQDLKHKEGLIGRTRIGDRNQIREYVTISASTLETPDDEHRLTDIGDDCLLMAYTHIAHDCKVGNGVIMANCASLSGHVRVDDRATIGGLSGIHQECAIGTLSFIGGLSRVNKDVPPYMIVEGNPGRCHGPNSVGLRRAGMSPGQRGHLKQMYRLVYRAGLNTTQALQEIEARVPESKERDIFVEFVRSSLRGITK
jgi:UDP-N-acetylglucosamine acyltransferase